MNLAVLTSLLLGAAVLLAAYLVWRVDRFRAEPLAIYALATVAGAVVGIAWRLAVLRWAGHAVTGGRIALGGSPSGNVVGVATYLAGLLFCLPAIGLLWWLTGRRPLCGAIDATVLGTAVGVGAATALSVARGWGDPPDEFGLFAVPPLLQAASLCSLIALFLSGIRFAERSAERATGSMALLLGGPVFASGLAAGLVEVDAAALRELEWLAAGVAAAALGLILVAAASFERRLLAPELSEEVSLGVMPQAIADLECSYWRRIRADWWPKADERRAINLLVTTLALRKRQLRGLDGERARLYSLEVGRLRERARRVFEPGRSEPLPD